MDKKSLLSQLKDFLADRFNLEADKADQATVTENIANGVKFKGMNLWILMFAIVVASVGLNVNSTAVIIGAMLISPLMGPIMGVGLSIGIYDFELLKKSLKNFGFAVAVSLAVSTAYFSVSPELSEQSELLSRTTPTIWDVLIASFGGLAGIVAQTRRDRTSTVIPGVAIATALMPPLCTAGFGLASGNWSYFFGAFYLFTINAVFIALATFFIVRFLKYQRVEFIDALQAKRVRSSMIIIITATLIPSIIIAFSVVEKAVFENDAKKFIKNVLTFNDSEVVNSVVNYSRKGSSIEVWLIGAPVASDIVNMARNQLKNYGLDQTTLIVRQANSGEDINQGQMQNLLVSNAQLLQDKNSKIAQLESKIALYEQQSVPSADVARELSALWNNMKDFSVSKNFILNSEGETVDSILVCIVTPIKKEELPATEREKIKSWLGVRCAMKSVKLIVE
ncbi:membrane protein [Mucinivorans hirudinis]|uniref:Membrane protein n=1 Tax=Mucinivorans hirudinis TaxID=1433126 RepID=A0A060R7Z6_9BACT|nr:membrane protein [Mucinivorans hirudinis]